MAEKKPPGGGRGRDSNSGERAEVRYFKGEEQFERWRKEFVQHQDYELKLAAVSKLSYEPADYQTQLVRQAYGELKLTDYSHLAGQAKTKVESEYVYPIITRIAAIVFLLGILVILFSPVTLLLTAALGVAAGVSLYFTIKDRDAAIIRAEQAAEAEAFRRNEQERLVYEEAKKRHEELENTRITRIEKLLAGETSAVRSRLDEVLNQLRLPMVVEVDIDFHVNIPLIRVWLPPKTVIPRQTCEMLPSGRIQYQDKDSRVYNKQYFELCAAIMLQIAAAVLANIPSFQEAYAAGIVNSEFSDDCILAVRVARDKIENINSAANAIAGMQALDAVYECDTSLVLYPVDMLRPPEWEDIEQQMLKSLRVRIFK
ncbi:MgtC/SapB family protein [Sporomusa termitida]|uniref:Uncharacterized protein n=1 Tax=Sporomusa termitida TaxID=2377 RepID=A0A517DUY0_9FIRM|nr:MgtC/SapB family protein [Sporomusa termitida]QDR81118.1 hypothetical protein SPTER_24740 [Sporomusa termitida]